MSAHDVHLRADEAAGFPGEWCGPVEIRDDERSAGSGDEPEWLPAMTWGDIRFGEDRDAAWGFCDARDPVRYDARRPEVAARIVAWAYAGEKCPACIEGQVSNPTACYTGDAPVDACRRCNGTSYTRPPHDLTPFLPTTLPGGRIASPEHSAALLVASVRGIVVGVGPVVGVLGEWRHSPRDTQWTWGRWSLTRATHARPELAVNARGWAQPAEMAIRMRSAHDLEHGPETGAEGRTCADRAALAHRFALLDADTLTLPEARAFVEGVRALYAERDDLAATLANERGEGEPPSPGWTYSHSQGRWSHPDGRWVWRNAWLRLADGTDCIRWGWERLGPSAEGREVTARAAMKAADAALAADGGGRG
jgi:hypothetical protein